MSSYAHELADGDLLLHFRECLAVDNTPGAQADIIQVQDVIADDGWHSWPERESQAERNPFIRKYAESLIEEELRKLIWDADKPKKRKRRRKRKKKPAAKTRIDEANEPRRMEL